MTRAAGQLGATTATTSPPASTLPGRFSPISPAPVRVGLDEPPPSWTPVATPVAMATKGFSRFRLASGSPKLSRFVATTSGAKKKKSPRSIEVKKTAGIEVKKTAVKQRADWNAAQEKSLVEILLEYKDYRGDNGWSTEVWNKMVKEFLQRNRDVLYSKAQLQEKEGQLKRDYKMLKEARRQSGSSWNHARNMVEGPDAMWDNLIVTFPKIKKFHNKKASFPLYDALGELYDGHLAEGTNNYVSLESPPRRDEPLLQIEGDQAQVSNEDDVQGEGAEVLVLEDVDVHHEGTQVHVHEEIAQTRNGTSSQDKRRAAPGPNKKEEKDGKRPRRSAVIEGMMQEYLQMRKQQIEVETT